MGSKRKVGNLKACSVGQKKKHKQEVQRILVECRRRKEKGFRRWDSNRRAMGEAHRCSKKSKQIYNRDHIIPKADRISNNRSIYAAEQQNCREKTPTKNCRSGFQKEKPDANSYYG
ncbi:36836_t:CDS:2 [Gigaspora margarita]|uniref:36836_t:CDS:1 n=1 Tax=Gigaspora margarita TaxID=4874 RepID=A0ABN7VV68_GIGMA|nr:36836_t:CDS:2 [Gigaspora margarita]